MFIRDVIPWLQRFTKWPKPQQDDPQQSGGSAEDQGVIYDPHAQWLLELQVAREKERRESGFVRAFQFRPFDSNDRISPLRESLVNKTLQAFAERFAFVCTVQEIARHTMPNEDSILVDDMVKAWKKQFWDAHEAARTMGYRVEEKYTQYLKDEKQASA